MISHLRKRLPVVTFTLCLAPLAGVQAATIRLAAVAVNGARFDSPQGAVDAVPGDRIEVEILVSGWGTEIDRVQVARVRVGNPALPATDGQPPTETCGSVPPLHLDTFDLRPAGAYFSVGTRGVCSAESGTPGASCVIHG